MQQQFSSSTETIYIYAIVWSVPDYTRKIDAGSI